MAQERIRLPASYGGIMRYFEDYKSKVVVKPMHVIILAIIIIIFVLFLHATNLFGF